VVQDEGERQQATQVDPLGRAAARACRQTRCLRPGTPSPPREGFPTRTHGAGTTSPQAAPLCPTSPHFASISPHFLPTALHGGVVRRHEETSAVSANTPKDPKKSGFSAVSTHGGGVWGKVGRLSRREAPRRGARRSSPVRVRGSRSPIRPDGRGRCAPLELLRGEPRRPMRSMRCTGSGRSRAYAFG